MSKKLKELLKKKQKINDVIAKLFKLSNRINTQINLTEFNIIDSRIAKLKTKKSKAKQKTIKHLPIYHQGRVNHKSKSVHNKHQRYNTTGKRNHQQAYNHKYYLKHRQKILKRANQRNHSKNPFKNNKLNWRSPDKPF